MLAAGFASAVWVVVEAGAREGRYGRRWRVPVPSSIRLRALGVGRHHLSFAQGFGVLACERSSEGLQTRPRGRRGLQKNFAARVRPSSTAKRVSDNSCARTGSPIESSNPSTTLSITVATPGTLSSTSHGRSCPSRNATGPQSVNHCEDWYKAIRPALSASFLSTRARARRSRRALSAATSAIR